MATFKVQIEDMIGDVGDDSALSQWLTDGAKEVIRILPPPLKEKCTTETTLNNSTTTMDMDGVGDVLYVTRLSANSSGFRVPCRRIPSMYAGTAESGSGNLMYEPSVSDPVYWVSSSSDVSILNVRPTPEATQTAIVYHIAFPTVAHGDSVIANFPDEAEHLVVLYATVKAAERRMLDEEDMEVYGPQLTALKQDYKQAIALFLGQGLSPQQGAR